MFRGADQEEWPSFEGFQGMSNREETPRAARLGGLYISSDLGTPRNSQEELEIAAGERDVSY